jgi:N-acetyl-anhydromuramyl-L-alanine amidase AmpD
MEHGSLNKVTSIVLHRTASSTADSVLGAYSQGRKYGAHFLIAKNGQIYQTANLKKRCLHVGILLPRCKIEENCDPKELKTINALIHEEGLGFGRRARNLSRHEAAKKYPLRYPSNDDSIGIEAVGRFLPDKKTFEIPTSKQCSSLKWLTNLLIGEYGLALRSDVYAHGKIARKEVTEGAQILQYLFSGAKE